MLDFSPPRFATFGKKLWIHVADLVVVCRRKCLIHCEVCDSSGSTDILIFQQDKRRPCFVLRLDTLSAASASHRSIAAHARSANRYYIGDALVAAQTLAPKMEERKSGAIFLTRGAFALAPNPDDLSLSIGKTGIPALRSLCSNPSARRGFMSRR
jgi:hypothetical protein